MSARRVVHVVLTENFAGTERVVCQEAAGLAERGWDVTVLGGDQARMRRSCGTAVSLRPAAGVASGVRQLLGLGRADIVHAHLTAAEVAAVCTRARHGAAVVSTRHIARPRGSSRVLRMAAPVLRRGMDQQLAISQYVAGRVDGASVVVPNGVEERAPSSVGRHREVLVMQRLEAEKSTDVAIRAWASSRLRDSGWVLTVAGDGQERATLEALVDELGVASSVRFVGWVDDNDELLSRAALLLAPCAVDGFGLSVVEAMAAGTPVLAASSGGYPEILAGTGVLFAPGDWDDAAAQLDAVVHGGGLARLAAAARDRQRAEFSVGTHLDRLEAVYRSLL